jgi:hypothetical protein
VVAAPLAALVSPTARLAWTPAAQASFDALKRVLSTSPAPRTFDPRRRAVLTTGRKRRASAARVRVDFDQRGTDNQAITWLNTEGVWIFLGSTRPPLRRDAPAQRAEPGGPLTRCGFADALEPGRV